MNIYVLATGGSSPVFTPPSVNLTIPESAPVASLFTLGQVTEVGSDNSTSLQCSIVSGNTNGVFRLVTSRLGGAVSIQLGLNAALNFEAVSSYLLVVRASDASAAYRSGDLTVAIFVADANDNPPVFSASIYTASIPENTAVGQSVLRVSATDADTSENGRISYSIDTQQSPGGGDFYIDPSSGTVYVNRSLSYATRRSYSLVVVARDHGASPLQSSVVAAIQVTQAVSVSPVVQVVFFSDDGSASVVKSAVSGDFVAQVSVTDPTNPNPSAVSMTLVGGDSHFALQRSGSTIYLMVVASSLNNAASSYTMSIIVTIGTKSVTKNFTLTIVPDSSSSGPQFSQPSYYKEIQEIALPGTSVLQVSIVGGAPDARFKYRIRGRSGSRSEWFQINLLTGLIATSATFDCLTVGDYLLNVTASDSSGPQLVAVSTSVLVRVTSVRRHPPYFVKPFYTVAVPENTPSSVCVLQVCHLSMLTADAMADCILRYLTVD